MINYFKGTQHNPFHISVGALVYNGKGEILVHHFKNMTLRGKLVEDLYILMRETVEPHESLEEALARGLMEEFGMVGELKAYIGSLKGRYPIKKKESQSTQTTPLTPPTPRDTPAQASFEYELNDPTYIWAEKTTLYFLVQYKEHDEKNREPNSIESQSTLDWLSPDELIENMKPQGKIEGSLDESEIVERFKTHSF